MLARKQTAWIKFPCTCFSKARSPSMRKVAAQSLSTDLTPDKLGRRPQLQADEVLYFAYGSNMNPQVLTGRRFVRPKESLPCAVPGYRLSFAVQGLPYAEPGFATIMPVSTEQKLQQQQQQQQQQQKQQVAGSFSSSDTWPCVHGVLHRVTQREWAHIQATEGVGSSAGYQVISVSCQLYDGSVPVQAVTLQAAQSSLHWTSRQVMPSARYLKLVQEGGRHHGLYPEYQSWLDSLKPYQPSSIQQQVLGGAASGAVLLSAAAPAVPLYIASRALGLLPNPSSNGGGVDSRSKPPGIQATNSSSSSSRGLGSSHDNSTANGADGLLPFLGWYMNTAQSWTWFVHDNALEPMLGSGCRTAEE